MIVESYEDVIVLSGSLRSNFWETIHTAISLTLKRHPTGVVIDCSGLTDATPAGAETFRDAMQFISRYDARVIVAAVPDGVLDVLRTVPEVRSQLAVAASVEAARRSLDLISEAPVVPKKKSASSEAALKIVVCLSGDDSDAVAIQLASQVADSVAAEIHPLFVVLVPRDLPLQTPLAQLEEKAAEALEQSKRLLLAKNLSHTPHLERGRDLPSTVHEVARELQADMIVVPLKGSEDASDDNARIVRSMLAKLVGKVVFVRG